MYFDFETIQNMWEKIIIFYYHKDGISTHPEFCRKHFLIIFYVGTLT